MSVFVRHPASGEISSRQLFSSWMDIVLKCSFLIVLLSIVQLIAYYYRFKIPIIHYLDMTEISTLFLNQVPNFLLLVIPVLGFLRMSRRLFVLLTAFLLITYSLTADSFTQAKGQFVFINCTIHLAAAPFFVRSNVGFGKTFRLNVRQFAAWKIAMYFVITSLMTMGIHGYLSAMLVQNRSLYVGTTMSLEDKMLVADSSFYFVGKTKNFIFWYNATKGTPVIYPAARLQQLNLETIDIESIFNSRPGPCDLVFP
jgi:hypothetical protein